MDTDSRADPGRHSTALYTAVHCTRATQKKKKKKKKNTETSVTPFTTRAERTAVSSVQNGKFLPQAQALTASMQSGSVGVDSTSVSARTAAPGQGFDRQP